CSATTSGRAGSTRAGTHTRYARPSYVPRSNVPTGAAPTSTPNNNIKQTILMKGNPRRVPLFPSRMKGNPRRVPLFPSVFAQRRCTVLKEGASSGAAGAAREQDASLLDVPHAARREPHERQEVGGEEEEREQRLVVRVAARDEGGPQPVLGRRRVQQARVRHHAAERQRQLEGDPRALREDHAAAELQQAIDRPGHRRAV